MSAQIPLCQRIVCFKLGKTNERSNMPDKLRSKNHIHLINLDFLIYLDLRSCYSQFRARFIVY